MPNPHLLLSVCLSVCLLLSVLPHMEYLSSMFCLTLCVCVCVCRLYDVGGQRTQRRKWLPFFDGVRAVLFLVDVSRYDLRPQQGSPTVSHITTVSRVNISAGPQNHAVLGLEGQVGREPRNPRLNRSLQWPSR